MRISDWSSDVCSSDLRCRLAHAGLVIQHDTLPALVDIDTIRAQPQSQPLEFAYRFSGLRLTRPACLQLQHLERAALTLHHQPRKVQLAQSCRFQFTHHRFPPLRGLGLQSRQRILNSLTDLRLQLGVADTLQRALSAPAPPQTLDIASVREQ